MWAYLTRAPESSAMNHLARPQYDLDIVQAFHNRHVPRLISSYIASFTTPSMN